MAVPAEEANVRLGKLREIAAARGGRCLSEIYENARTKLLWECSKGHQWEATPDQVKGGRNKEGNWCPKCARVRARQKQMGSLSELVELAKARGGKCLSTEYKGVKVHHLWQCAEGHEWEAVPLSIKGRPSKKGSWCPECSGNNRLNIELMEEVATSRGGKCLSGSYKNNSTSLCWECSEGHTWIAPPARILSGGWCPKCTFSTGEKICRMHFEHIFGKKFPPAHKRELSWLVADNGATSMELDGYCKDLQLAFEHHGKHHYQNLRYSKNNESSLEAVKKRDERKRGLCAKHGVTLIEIPEIGGITKLCDVEETIKTLCKKAGIEVPTCSSNGILDIGKAFISDNKDRMRSIQKVAESKGGECLSTEYISSTTRMRWKCAEGHEWETTPNNVMPRKNDPGTWCPVCSAKQRGISQRGISRKTSTQGAINNKSHKVIEIMPELQRIAAEKGGHLLSGEYIRDDVKLSWQCSLGHKWMATPGQIKGTSGRSGTWCPICAEMRRGSSQRLSIEAMQELARKRGGKCLSNEYKNARTPLRWECARGHQWDAVADTVRNRGSWCPRCARKGGVI